jgi:hypothetical protein
MASINFSSIGTNFASLVSALTSAGVTSTSLPSVLSSIGSVFTPSNPNQAEELALCAQIMQMQGNPAIAQQLEMKLATEQGMPPAAQAIVMQMLQPGANVTQLAVEAEQVIRAGG